MQSLDRFSGRLPERRIERNFDAPPCHAEVEKRGGDRVAEHVFDAQRLSTKLDLVWQIEFRFRLTPFVFDHMNLINGVGSCGRAMELDQVCFSG